MLGFHCNHLPSFVDAMRCAMYENRWCTHVHQVNVVSKCSRIPPGQCFMITYFITASFFPLVSLLCKTTKLILSNEIFPFLMLFQHGQQTTQQKQGKAQSAPMLIIAFTLCFHGGRINSNLSHHTDQVGGCTSSACRTEMSAAYNICSSFLS